MMASMYIVADLILNLVDLGVRREAIKAKLKEAELAGSDPSQIAEMLRKMETDAIVAAQDAINASKTGS